MNLVEPCWQDAPSGGGLVRGLSNVALKGSEGTSYRGATWGRVDGRDSVTWKNSGA